MPSTSPTSASTASGRRTLKCCKAGSGSEAEILERIRHRRLHHLGLVRGMALRVPELEMAAHAEQHDVAHETRGGAQLGSDENARRRVDVDVHRVAEEDPLPAARIHRQGGDTIA